MTEPTDAEIIALADETRTAEGGANGYILPISFCRAVLAKWGTPPAVAGEPVFAFRRKGLDDFCTCTEERYAELSAKPNLFETRIFYTTPQPTQAQAGAVPMSHEDAKALVRKYGNDPLHLVLQVERHHDITGGQHGTE